MELNNIILHLKFKPYKDSLRSLNPKIFNDIKDKKIVSMRNLKNVSSEFKDDAETLFNIIGGLNSLYNHLKESDESTRVKKYLLLKDPIPGLFKFLGFSDLHVYSNFNDGKRKSKRSSKRKSKKRSSKRKSKKRSSKRKYH